jgi:hypothetical protein
MQMGQIWSLVWGKAKFETGNIDPYTQQDAYRLITDPLKQIQLYAGAKILAHSLPLPMDQWTMPFPPSERYLC